MTAASQQSAGLLMFRRAAGGIEILLAHPGGPFWAKKDEGAWTIPKGLLDGDDPLGAAIREFSEETGFAPCPPYLPLGTITQKSGKVVHAWAFEGDCDVAAVKSNVVTTEWPHRSGKMIEVAEVDRCEWFTPDAAKRKINPAQAPLIDRLSRLIASSP